MLAPRDTTIILLFLCVASITCLAVANDCHAIKVPDYSFEIIHWMNLSTDVAWSRSVPIATYNVTSCVTPKKVPFMPSLKPPYPVCPRMVLLNKCHEYRKKENGTICNIAHNGISTGDSVEAILHVHVPGCSEVSRKLKVHINASTSKMHSVRNLAMTVKRTHLELSWAHEYDYLDEKLCYFYIVREITDSGKTIEIEKKNIDYAILSTSVTLPENHAFKVYQFCVNAHFCLKDDKVRSKPSHDTCVEKRMPAEAPSKPLQLLCGMPDLKHCNLKENSTHRNVTLRWQLPDKNSWNGLDTVIKVKINIESNNGNTAKSFNISAKEKKLTLTLRRDLEYHIRLIFCSSGGEGPASQPLVIKKGDNVDRPSGPPTNITDRGMDWTLLSFLLGTLVIGIGIILTIIICLFLNYTRSKKSSPLPLLNPPERSTGRAGTDDNLLMHPVDYDLLRTDENFVQPDSKRKLSSDGSKSSDSGIDTNVPSTTCQSYGIMDDVRCKPGDQSDRSFISLVNV